VDSSFVSSVAWVQNTSSAQWITAPGALDPGDGTYNSGGSYLPGNGTSGSNNGIYIYTLAFTITGTGGGTVSNHVSISMTLAADDELRLYVNPSGNGGSLPTGTAAFSIGAGAWTNTVSKTIDNYNLNNATFKIGTNYLVVVVENTDSHTGSNSTTNWNAGGFMMYQVGAVATIDGQPVPEMAPWMPIAGALGLYGLFAFHRRRRQPVVDSAAC
jgi:hypothetical protein